MKNKKEQFIEKSEDIIKEMQEELSEKLDKIESISNK